MYDYLKGDSTCPGVIDLVLANTLVKSELEIMSYYDYIISEENIADNLTRTNEQKSFKFNFLLDFFKPIMMYPVWINKELISKILK